MRSAVLRSPSARFLFSSLLVVTACVVLLRTHAMATNASVAAWGATFDLTITIPLLWFFFVVRNGKARPFTIVPVFILGTVLAAAFVPRGEQQFLKQLQWILVPAAELFLVGTVVVRVRREGFTAGMRSLLGEGRVATIVASEVAMLYYAFFCWRKKAKDGFTFHERVGWGSIVAGIVVLIVAESIGTHLLLLKWKAVAAWIWTALDLWAIVWLIGDYHALRLRRTTIDDRALHIRFGLRWNLTVPFENIESITEVRDEGEWKRRDVLRMALFDEPRWLIALREPLVAQGYAGLTKTVRTIAVLPDDDAFVTALRTVEAG